MKRAAAALILLILVLPICAQEGSDNFDDLFEGEILEEEGEPAAEESQEEDLFESDLFEESAETGQAQEIAPEEAFLVSEQLEWGGSFDLSLTAQVASNDYITPWEKAFWDPDISSLTSEVSGDLFFDARPDRDFRVFGKIKAAYRYPADPLLPAPPPGEWEVEIFELFSDFQIKDLLFFRAGKQTVQWGVGYFFSPADVLNLVSIDPEDPGAEREGPIALKAHFPFAAHNAYLYLVANDVDKPFEIAVAPKVELLLGSYELGIGGFYQFDLTPNKPMGMLTLTGPLRDLDLFAEAMIRDYEDILLFSGTTGFSYINSDWNLSLFAQYFLRDQGCTAPITPGRHYLAASVGWSDLLDSDFGLSLLYLANFSDGSGLITPTVTWDPIDHVRLSTGVRIRYGKTGDEYGPNPFDPSDGIIVYTFSVSLGAGRF